MLRLCASVVLCMLLTITLSDALSIKNCNSNEPVQLSLSKAPETMTLKNNETFHVSGGVRVKNYVVPKRLRLKVDVSKKMWFWVKLPCIGCDQSISCKKVPQICEFSKMCTDCSISVQNIKLQMPPNIEELIPRFLPKFVLSGTYWVKLNVVNEDDEDEVVACMEITTSVKAR